MSLTDDWNALLPYQFSWLAVGFYGTLALLYGRGQWRLRHRGEAPSHWRSLAFWAGLALAYTVMHTRFDYYAQFMFFMHRLQHLALHHIAPFLLMLSNPWHTLAAGVPDGRPKRVLAAMLRSRWLRWPYRLLQSPPVAALLFAGIIYLWLYPPLHFYAMLDHRRYLLMNWSMLLDGLLFWWLMLDPRSPQIAGTLGFGKRILLLWAATVPQLALGAYIALSRSELYDIYDLCGRAWPIDPHRDQVLGGLITWIPPGMMTVLGMLVILRQLLHHSAAQPAASLS